MGKLIGKFFCWLGFHKVEDSYCQREGCEYHEIND